jgi:hypothetical protein
MQLIGGLFFALSAYWARPPSGKKDPAGLSERLVQ